MVAAAAFFVFSLLALWATQNALRGPIRARVPLLRPLWLPATLASELLPIRMAIHLGVVALFVLAGALEHRLGWLALVLSGITVAGSSVLQVRAHRTGAVMERALSDAGFDPDVGTRIHWPSVLAAYPYRVPDSVGLIEDIPYGDGLRLDLYRSRTEEKHRATLLQIHGGGWVGGDKQQQARPLLHLMAQRGWAVASAAYPLSPAATFPAQLVALKRAVAWLRREGPHWGIDPGFVAVTGGSAGGHLAALLALTGGREDLQPGFEAADTRIQACVAAYGVYDFLNRHATRDDWGVIPRAVMKARPHERPDAYRTASPIDQVHAAAPPFLVLHGSHDALVPPQEARVFVAALRTESRNPVVYAELPGAGHAFDVVHSVRTHHVISGIAAFLEGVRSNAAARQAADRD